MTVRSMTGYGRAEASDATHTIGVELKTVNNRFLDFQCRVSRDQLHLEPLLRKELGEYVLRGSVTCHVHYEIHGMGAVGVALNAPLLKAYADLVRQAARELGTEAGISREVNITDLLKIPDMVVQGQSVEPPEIVAEKVLPVFRRAGEELMRMREREGAALAHELEQRILAFYPALEKVQALVPKRQAETVAKMRERLKEILNGQAVAEDRLLTEIGLMAERLDITEEIVRLRAHLDHFLETLRDHPAPGKKLGFLQQEMLREVNTLGNKNQYSEIQQISVGWKEEIEIIREQLMNIE